MRISWTGLWEIFPVTQYLTAPVLLFTGYELLINVNMLKQFLWSLPDVTVKQAGLFAGS